MQARVAGESMMREGIVARLGEMRDPAKRATAGERGRVPMSHSYTNLLYHVVYGSKDRQPFISGFFEPRLYQYLGGVIRGLKGVSLEIGGVEDHVHILVRLHPTIAISDFLENQREHPRKRPSKRS